MDSLSREQYETIEKALGLRSTYLQKALESLRQGNATKDDKAALERMLSEEFARIGLDENDEPNEFGRSLDEVVGKLGFDPYN